MSEGDRKGPGTGGGGSEPPADDGIMIEFVDHQDEGPHLVGRDETPEGAPAAGGDGAGATDERVQELEERLLRLRADFENHRKRTERERGEMGQAAKAAVVKELLPVLDNLERALSHRPEGIPEEYSRGLDLILQQFGGVLTRAGLESVLAEGQPFDPAFHEACAVVPTADLAPNRVVDVIQKGYTMGGKLLRPARVRVSAPPEGGGGNHG